MKTNDELIDALIGAVQEDMAERLKAWSTAETRVRLWKNVEAAKAAVKERMKDEQAG